MDYVQLAVPFFILAVLLELTYGFFIKKNTYRFNDTISSIFMGSLRSTSKFIGIGIGGYIFYLAETKYALWRMDESSLFTWIFAFIAYDFFYYWFHRISHERQIFWASHVAHHQSEDYNLSTALRQTGTGFLISWVFYIPLFIIGVPSYVYVSVATLNLVYQFWVHTEHIPKLGWYELFFITPSNHRVHHARNEAYIDKNYGGVFIIWDRIFGTFKEEDEDKPCIYGLRSPIRTFNPIWANFHIYVKMIRDFLAADSFKEKLYVPFSKTGWSPSNLNIKPVNTDKDDFERFDPKSSKAIGLYGVFQLIILVLLGLSLESSTLGYARNALIIFMIAFTMFCVSRWFDNKSVLKLEIIRLIILPLVFIYFLPLSLELIYLTIGYVLFNAVILYPIYQSSLRTINA